MSKKQKKPQTPGKNKTKTIIIMTAIGLAFSVLLAVIFRLPEINAKKSLDGFISALTENVPERVTVLRQQAFSSGSFENVTQSYEETLTEDNLSRLVSLFEKFEKEAVYTGAKEGLFGTSDYRITLISGGERFFVYVSDDCIYTLKGTLRSCFKSKNNDIYDFLEELKNSRFDQ